MKGHMQDGKFHPHTEYKKGTRKSRDQKEKTQGTKIRKQRDTKGQISFRDSLKLGNSIQRIATIRDQIEDDEIPHKYAILNNLKYSQDDIADVVLNNEVNPRFKRDAGVKIRKTRSLKSSSSELQWGFDLTDFKPDGFQKVLKELGITQEYVRTWHEADPEINLERQGRGFVWEGEGILIETKNNPITGQYGTERMREPEINYAGYIGITGLPDQVKNAVKLIKKNTTYRKNESPNEREYI